MPVDGVAVGNTAGVIAAVFCVLRNCQCHPIVRGRTVLRRKTMKRFVAVLSSGHLLAFSFVAVAATTSDPVVVTATRTAATADDALASVTVITRQDIERLQARSV